MPITPINAIAPIAPPAAPAINPPEDLSLAAARNAGIRLVIWFDDALILPADEIICTSAAMDALFGEDAAQRLLITPTTAWLRRLLPAELAGELDRAKPSFGRDSMVMPRWANVYLMRLAGESGVDSAIELLGTSPAVRRVYAEPSFVPTATIPAHPNATFTAHQGYLRSPGINAPTAWTRNITGKGIRVGVVDRASGNMPSHWNHLIATMAGVGPPSLAPSVPPPTTAAAASAYLLDHGVLVAGIAAGRDNTIDMAIGAAPEAQLVFSGIASNGAFTLAEVTTALGYMNKLNAGDVVNLSLGMNAALDVTKPYSRMATIRPSAGNFNLVTRKIAAAKLPVARVVRSSAPLEMEPTLALLIRQLVTKGITIVTAAGNGMEALYENRFGKGVFRWLPQGSADLDGAWRLMDTSQLNLDKFDRDIQAAGRNAVSLDRRDKGHNDAGSIIVAAAIVPQPPNPPTPPTLPPLVNHHQYNHGSRVDCCAIVPLAQKLGIVGNVDQNLADQTGTSFCAPVIAGAAALLQHLAITTYGAPLLPRVVRAMLSDAANGTTPTGLPVGVMPDLAKLIAFVDAAKANRMALVTALATRRQQLKTNQSQAAAAPAGPPANPYAVHAQGVWADMPLAAETDVFFPVATSQPAAPTGSTPSP